MFDEAKSLLERTQNPSRIVGLYQSFFRRYIEHFFPDAVLDTGGDRDVARFDHPRNTHFQTFEDPSGLGIEIDWFGLRYSLQPSSPSPFLPAERKLIDLILGLLDKRYRSMFDPETSQLTELFHYAIEDMVVSEFIDAPNACRIPAAIEALRVAALSTYENRRVSTGALLLGTPNDPASPERLNIPGAPRYNVRLTAIKGFHRLCDGVNTVYLVDEQGELVRAIDIHNWAAKTQGPEPLASPCPRPYHGHALATRTDRHVCLVLTPAQEIKVFANENLMFSFSDARWRMLDIPTKFTLWCKAVGPTVSPELARLIFEAALNLGEARRGALFVVTRDAMTSLSQLIAPTDRITGEVAVDDPHDPDNLSPRLAKRSLHHLVRNQTLLDLDPSVIESLACIDGAVVVDRAGRLLTFGAILRIAPEVLRVARAVEGARTLAALAASFHGPTLKISEDGKITMFLGGRRVWDL